MQQIVVPKGLKLETVMISCGTRDYRDTPGAMTVAQVRQEARDLLAIPDGAVAVMNGTPVPANQEVQILVQPGHLEFVHRTGTKG